MESFTQRHPVVDYAERRYLDSVYTLRRIINTEVRVGLVTCKVIATVSETVDLRTGDETISTTIEQIMEPMGQTISPSGLTISEFRNIVQQVKHKVSL